MSMTIATPWAGLLIATPVRGAYLRKKKQGCMEPGRCSGAGAAGGVPVARRNRAVVSQEGCSMAWAAIARPAVTSYGYGY